MLVRVLLLATLALADHLLKVTISGDDQYVLFLPGQTAIQGPNDFSIVKTYTLNVTGYGPWVIGIRALDAGVISGLFAGVSLDNLPYTATGFSDTKFRATLVKPDSDWLKPNYNVSTWERGAALATPDCTNPIWDRATDGAFSRRLYRQMPEQVIKASWLPGCSTTNNQVYFRVVVRLPACRDLETYMNDKWTSYSQCKQGNPNSYLDEASGCPAKYQLYSNAFDTYKKDCFDPSGYFTKFFP